VSARVIRDEEALREESKTLEDAQQKLFEKAAAYTRMKRMGLSEEWSRDEKDSDYMVDFERKVLDWEQEEEIAKREGSVSPKNVV